MMTPLVQSPDLRAVSLATAPCRSSARRRTTRTQSPPPRQPRRDGASRSGSLPRPKIQTRPARRTSRAERRRTGRPGCVAYTSQTSSPGARVTGQNGHGSAKQAVPRTACFARTLSAYLHRRGDRKWFRDGSVYRFGACFTVLPCPDRCPVPASGRPPAQIPASTASALGSYLGYGRRIGRSARDA